MADENKKVIDYLLEKVDNTLDEKEKVYFGVWSENVLFEEADGTTKNLNEKLNETAIPKKHLSEDKNVFGGADFNNYGHVKTSDNIKSPIDDTAVVLTQKASLNLVDDKIKTHAGEKGTSLKEGHVYLSDAYTKTAPSSEVAVSQKALNTAMGNTVNVTVEGSTLVIKTN